MRIAVYESDKSAAGCAIAPASARPCRYVLDADVFDDSVTADIGKQTEIGVFTVLRSGQLKVFNDMTVTGKDTAEGICLGTDTGCPNRAL